MSYDFYSEKYNEKPDISEWNQYTITKCTQLGDEKHYPNKFPKHYKRNQIDEYFDFEEILDINKQNLPKMSILIKVQFRLEKPFLSKGDEQFWPNLYNPISKEKILKCPIMKASSWKGCLRSVAIKEGIIDKKSSELFGNPKSSDDSKRGRLNFFTTFFDNVDLDVIAPHDRETKTAKSGMSPIYLEIVPANKKDEDEKDEHELKILYYPFDKLHDDDIKNEVKEDIKKTLKAIKLTLTKHGFGAKTADGYGKATMESTSLFCRSCNELYENILRNVKEEISE